MSKAASYSRIALFEKCPASFEWQYILGNKREYPPGPAAERGTRIHQSIENWYNDAGSLDEEIPMQVAEWLNETYIDMQDGRCEATPEYEFALTATWEETTFDHEDAYVRGFIDGWFHYEDDQGESLLLHEYKTGQMYDDHADQRALYAMVALLHVPDVDTVEVEGIYIDKKKRVKTSYSRSMLTSMKFSWKRRIDRLYAGIYPARPGSHCRWCPKSSKHGEGPCQLG